MEMRLDARTLVVVSTFVALVPGLISLLVWRTKRTYPGRWVLGNLAVPLCLLLLCMRGTAPDWISIMLANAAGLGAAILFFHGIRLFQGLRIYWWPECATAVVALVAVAYFRYATGNINIRTLAMGLALGSLGLACGITLLEKIPARRRFSTTFTGIVFILSGMANLLRGIYVYTYAPLTNLYDPSVANAAFFLGASLAVVGWSFGFVLMTGERLPTGSGETPVDGLGMMTLNESAHLFNEPVPEGEVRRQLQKMVECDVFRKSPRMERFLTLAVERTLDGHAEQLKEYTLGRDVFNRGESYDPRTDSIVRVEAQRLRRKLREYYDNYGKNDRVVVECLPGSYVPIFRYSILSAMSPSQYPGIQSRSITAGPNG